MLYTNRKPKACPIKIRYLNRCDNLLFVVISQHTFPIVDKWFVYVRTHFTGTQLYFKSSLGEISVYVVYYYVNIDNQGKGLFYLLIILLCEVFNSLKYVPYTFTTAIIL